MKKTVVAFFVLTFFFSRPLSARQGFSIGLGPVGNIYLIDTIPVLDPGVGGFMSFEYRFHEQVAFETAFVMTTQDASRPTDRDIIFLGMPVFDIKLYFLSGDPKFDPYAGTGIGLYWLTEGSLSNNSGGTGMGAQLDLGFDYYLTDFISLGFEGVFRSIAFVTDFGTPSVSQASLPYSLLGKASFHF
ncbi:MAG: hypothetical protein HYY44_01340 [Deltaproteobacteria bacterium]|nr:hypothetical protein [Deltaproteobacteria bacterium]MBI4374705.1 hypothetical protein [Deltaproteobacteria bacterium]